MRRLSISQKHRCLLLGIYAWMADAPMLARGNTTPVQAYSFTSESVLRSHALEVPRPAYPSDSLCEGKSGVAVVRVRVSPKGNVSWVGVLEAPSVSIGASVRKAVLQWRFRHWWNDDAPLYAKLTFYFVINRSHGLVVYPSELPLHAKSRFSATAFAESLESETR
jgi:TonB family protein